jgi:hypothetical protein
MAKPQPAAGAACRAGLPFITTGFFFHQARLAQEKGWELSWVAVWFIAWGPFRLRAK